MSRRSRTNSLTVIYWRDIPAQVTATAGGENHKVLLEDRFQHAIDRAATVAGLTETHAYVGQWRQERLPLEGDPDQATRRLAEELTSAYDRTRLEAIVAAGGLARDQQANEPDPDGSNS